MTRWCGLHPAPGPDAGGLSLLLGAGRAARPLARTAGPGPAAGHPRQGLGGRLRRPGAARPPGSSRAHRRGRLAGPGGPDAGRPAGEGPGGARPPAADPGREGGTVAAGQAGPSRCRRCSRSPSTMPRCWSRRPMWPARCRSRRCSAPTGPTTSGSRFREAASWSSRGQRGQPARAAMAGSPSLARPPGQQARRAGTPTPCAARRRCTGGAGRARIRPAGAHHRARRRGRQPGHRAPGWRGHDHSATSPRRAARVCRRHAGHGHSRAGLDQRAPGRPDAGPRVLPRPAAVPGSSGRDETPASCSPSTPRPRWSARTRCLPTRRAWTPSPHQASRKITCPWGGPRFASCATWCANVRSLPGRGDLLRHPGGSTRGPARSRRPASLCGPCTTRYGHRCRADGRGQGGGRADRGRGRAAAPQLCRVAADGFRRSSNGGLPPGACW